MNAATYFLDVNVPMYAAGKPHAYQQACVWIMQEIASERVDVTIDTEIIQEILYRFGAMQQWQTGTQLATSLLTLAPTVYAVTKADVVQAVQLFGQYAATGIKARDIIHVAVMQANGLSAIITTDRHFDLVPGIVRLDPLDLFLRKQFPPVTS